MSLFSARNELWWRTGYSIVLSGGFLTELVLLESALNRGQLSSMWLFWCSSIGSAFSIVFFAHLWKNVPIKTENELIFFRFSGNGASILHSFRSIYLGFCIIPLILGISIHTYITTLISIVDVDEYVLIGIIFLALFLIATLNSLTRIIKIDFYLTIVFILCIILLYIINLENVANFFSSTGSKLRVSVFSAQSDMIYPILIFLLIQWWSAYILDFPDMTGQKLMASKDLKSLTKSLVLPRITISVIRFSLLLFPFILAKNTSFFNQNSESALGCLLNNVIPAHWHFLIIIFLSIPFFSFIQSQLNWAGALISQNQFISTIHKVQVGGSARSYGRFYMLLILLISFCIALSSTTILDLAKYLLSLTAGVGPVFILRWYWHRVNAWSQLSAMISALIYSITFDLFINYSDKFHGMINKYADFGLDIYCVKLIVLTFLVTVTWLLVTFLTERTDSKTLEKFSRTIHPGGLWHNKFKGSIFLKFRFPAWILLSSNGVLFYFILIHSINANFVYAAWLLIINAALFYSGYKLLLKANKTYESSFIV